MKLNRSDYVSKRRIRRNERRRKDSEKLNKPSKRSRGSRN